jgi:hypothetical protein
VFAPFLHPVKTTSSSQLGVQRNACSTGRRTSWLETTFSNVTRAPVSLHANTLEGAPTVSSLAGSCVGSCLPRLESSTYVHPISILHLQQKPRPERDLMGQGVRIGQRTESRAAVTRDAPQKVCGGHSHIEQRCTRSRHGRCVTMATYISTLSWAHGRL